MISIKDGRLGIIFWSIRIAILSYLLYQIADERRDRLVEIPTGAPSFWFENGRLSEVHNRVEPYCDNAEYDYWPKDEEDPKSYWIDRGAQCLPLWMEAMYERQTTSAHVFTFMKQLHMRKASCSAESACQAFGGGIEGREHRDIVVDSPSGDIKTCTCGKLSDYFVMGAEELELWVDHAFASTSVRWHIYGSNFRETSNEASKSVRTCVKTCKTDELMGPKKCEDGCYKTFEPGQTMAMSLKEWLSIGGASLDERVQNNVIMQSKHDGTNGSHFPFRRLVGTNLNIYLNYVGDAGTDEHITCNVEVEVVDRWTSFGKDSKFKSFNGPEGENEAYEFYRRGIAVQFFAGGQIHEFDEYRLIMVFVQGVGLLAIADVLVELVARYLLPESAIYSRAKNEALIHSRLLAKFGLNAAMVCRVFSSLNTDPNAKDRKISAEELTRAFSGYFSEADAKKMGHATLQLANMSGALDDDGGEITVEALVELLTSNECTLEDLESKADELFAPKQWCCSRSRVEPEPEGSNDVPAKIVGQEAELLPPLS